MTALLTSIFISALTKNSVKIEKFHLVSVFQLEQHPKSRTCIQDGKFSIINSLIHLTLDKHTRPHTLHNLSGLPGLFIVKSIQNKFEVEIELIAPFYHYLFIWFYLFFNFQFLFFCFQFHFCLILNLSNSFYQKFLAIILKF